MVKLTNKGPVRIVRLGAKEFRVSWFPYSSAGGVLGRRKEQSVDKVESLLRKDLKIEDDEVQKAMKDLADYGRASIQRVRLSPRKARRLGLMGDAAEPENRALSR